MNKRLEKELKNRFEEKQVVKEEICVEEIEKEEAFKNIDMNSEDFTLFISSDIVSNMTIKKVAVPQSTVLNILNAYELPKEDQSKAVIELVNRTTGWLELDTEVQHEKIKLALTQETVACFLNEKNILKGCSMYECGIDEEGTIVVNGFYVDGEADRIIAQELRREKDKEMKTTRNNVISFNKKRKKKK